MNTRRLFSRFLTLPLLFAGLCACSDTVHLQRQIDKLEQSVSAMRSLQASNTSDIEALQADVRGLTGRLDEAQHYQEQRIGKEVSGLREDLSNLKSRVPPPAIVPASALEADESSLQAINTPGSRLVLDSLVFLRDAKYREAEALLQNALEYGSQDAGYPLAVFWNGVAADGRGDNTGALRGYNELAVQFPKHPRTPLALLRQADVFVRLRDKNAASFALKKLIADYPKSTEAATARQKLIEVSRK